MVPRSLLHAVVIMAVLSATGSIPAIAADSPQQLKAACDKGNAAACDSLGWRYWKGDGVKQDIAQASDLFRKSCATGDPHGCVNLGVMYAQGTGTGPDPVQAVALYRKACDGREPQAVLI